MHPAWLPKISGICRTAFRNLAVNDLFRMAGATAFFTTFALPPILMIIVRTLGFFGGRQVLGRAFIGPLRELFGQANADGILQTIRSFSSLQRNYFAAGGIFLFLVFVATTLFKVVRTSIDQLWHIRRSRGVSFRSVLLSRAISVAVILAGGVLFLTVQLIDSREHLLNDFTGAGFSDAAHYAGKALNAAVVTLTSAVWFYILFRFLPDGRPDRRITIWGALLTGTLFTLGKALLSLLLRPAQVTNFYGVSGAFAVVLLFMFYSSIFLYAGAAIISAWSTADGRPVVPKLHAEAYHIDDGY